MSSTATFSSAGSLVSAVVAPAILILACGSLITTTANRLSILLHRVRDLAAELESLQAQRSEANEAKRAYISLLLTQGSVRVHLLQRVLGTLYFALASLVLTSVCIGIGTLTGISANFVAVGVLASVAFLFYASTLLIRESRLALRAVNAELDYVRGILGA